MITRNKALRREIGSGFKKYTLLYIQIIATYLLSLNAAVHATDNPIAIDSRIKTYIYSKTEVFPIIVHYGYSMHLDLRPKEAVRDIIMGDNSDWNITIKNNRVFIRANETGAHTNMTVITNMDVYEFDLFSRSAEDGVDLDMAYVVRFFYPPTPEEMASVLGDDIFQTQNVNAKPSFEIGELLSGDIDYNFKTTGDMELAPAVIFTDGKLTYMKFADTNPVLPKIYEIKSDDTEKVLDILEYNGYIILNSTASRFILRRNQLKATITKQ